MLTFFFDVHHYCGEVDLDRYYEISAPEQDLVGDAEAFGWYEAYKQLNSNSIPKLSEILEAYYKVNNPQNISPTYDNRWRLFCENIAQPLVAGSPGNFKWEPGNDPPSNWSDYSDFKDRVENFANFWLTKLYDPWISVGIGYGWLNQSYITKPTYDPTNIDFCINNFLNFCKSKFESEQNTTL